MEGIVELQDLGELTPTIRPMDEFGPSGVEPLSLDDDSTFGEATEAFREVLDEHYGDHIESLAGDDEEVIVNRVVIPSGDLPHIEYSIVDKRE